MCPQNTGAATNSSPQPVPYPPFQPHINNPPPPLQPQHHQQPPVIIVNPPTSLTPAVWTSGLLECFNDPSSCLLTLCCPCVAVGQIAEIVSRGRTGCLCAGTICLLTESVGLSCFYTCNNRIKLRAHFSLPGHQCGDFCMHCCCTPCALCQEYRELKQRGIDPSQGWEFNKHKLPVNNNNPPQVQMMT